MLTLADFIAPNLRILSVGLNPSLPSVRDGYYFSGRTNRFWRALNQSRLLAAPLEPSVDAMQKLLDRDRIGFTDTVKRPTAGAGDLNAADFRQWVPVLESKLAECQPQLVWFHGKVAYKNFLKYSSLLFDDDIPWGLQAGTITGSKVFISPNSSAANAVFSLDDLIGWYNRLAEIVK